MIHGPYIHYRSAQEITIDVDKLLLNEKLIIKGEAIIHRFSADEIAALSNFE